MQASWFLEVAAIIVVGLYGLSLTLIGIYCYLQAWLCKQAFQKKETTKPVFEWVPEEMPVVTIQLPLFNEKYVAERLIRAVAAINYPQNLLEIQILDDSTDETGEICQRLVKELLEKGFNIHYLHRMDRTGFKAGALQNGLQTAKGEFIAIFDADFLPPADFLLKTLPSFVNPKVGMVQTRWGHLNPDFSLLTRMQKMGLDVHFLAEQSGRFSSGFFMNFNGTAGVWRKSCITDAGGWSADTLTEDLDLSYRAQLRGWKFVFLPEVVSPAELPAEMNAIRSQQFRWNKGGAEVAAKLIPKIWFAGIPYSVRFHGILHLLNSSVFFFILLTAILSVPVLWIKAGSPAFSSLFGAGSFFLSGLVVITWVYWKTWTSDRIGPGTFLNFLTDFLMFLALSMGMSLHNTLAVLKGWLGIRSPFVRTPKFNIRENKDSFATNVYRVKKLPATIWMEMTLTVYFIFGIGLGVFLGDFGLVPFHLLLLAGFGMVSFFSLKHAFDSGNG